MRHRELIGMLGIFGLRLLFGNQDPVAMRSSICM